ncbi:GDCCVxC domain-containing (seleno)protein [Castellaniella defragrans]|uniref:GDCCVxC domain-containing (seleno)protein n=1 Tax=Castellaniella defragrans TaxID=75697 RepID=UPI000A0029C8|nr:GDCCVxC domain-containing (seleno)protein [Castellaniella defragrans]
MEAPIIFESVVTCPHCGHMQREAMPVDTCQFFYECGQCKTLLKPKSGDCCVFCSYGSVPCPSIQEGKCCS